MTAVLRTPRAVLVDLLVAVLVVECVAVLVRGAGLLVTDARGVAGLGLGLGLAAALASVSLVPLGTPTLVIAGGLTFVVGVAALIWGPVATLGPVLAAVFVAGVVVCWLLTVVALRADRARHDAGKVRS
ncbi:hypothetical protein ACFPK1_16410 [Actinomycetospora rhizophila]|uniref:Integral membrane protein n=1 Tax=Actinomycetospora rhizophila TaxID=1416876 RepID=A0ABV9ZFA3_9PSEU